VVFGKEGGGMVFLGRDLMDEKNYSEETAQAIDSEIKRIIEESYEISKKILTENRDKLEALAQLLLEKETLDAEEIRKITGLQAVTPVENGKSAPSCDPGWKPTA
jgi:cell division protease FtsH